MKVTPYIQGLHDALAIAKNMKTWSLKHEAVASRLPPSEVRDMEIYRFQQQGIMAAAICGKIRDAISKAREEMPDFQTR